MGEASVPGYPGIPGSLVWSAGVTIGYTRLEYTQACQGGGGSVLHTRVHPTGCGPASHIAPFHILPALVQGPHPMDVTNPNECIRFGPMGVTKPHELILLGKLLAGSLIL